MVALSLLQQHRLKYKPKLPAILRHLTSLVAVKESQDIEPSDLQKFFSHICAQPILHFKKGEEQPMPATPLKVGVVLSGGQAPGGHNVISGLFDALKTFHSESRLIGFCDGPNGIVKNKTLEITAERLASYRNQGGFDLIGSGRTKIETPEQFKAAEETIKALDLDGLVIIGGDDSNTNAAFLAEYCEKKGLKTRVIGVPKTIDGDLKNAFIEVSFGFDTACKVYSEIIGNILRDTLSAKKYYYFIKLMGRSASHITLECALQTHVNMALISEEVAENKQTLSQLIDQIANMICIRAEQGKNYGAILIPEGIIEFIPEFKRMIQELNQLLASLSAHAEHLESRKDWQEEIKNIANQLSPESAQCFLSLPGLIQEQLLLDRDPHGNVQVSKIETERLLIALVEKELHRRKQQGSYKGHFSAQALFCGYEGRSGLPSNFDSQYCYALGYLAALLIHMGATGYICCIKHLTEPVEEWEIIGLPLFSLLHMEMREGKQKAVIQKALVDLAGDAFIAFKDKRETWLKEDDYCSPGPIQFNGPPEITDAPPIVLIYEQLSAPRLS